MIRIKQLRVPIVLTLVNLIPLFPTALRPLSPSLHTLAVELVCQRGATRSITLAGAELFSTLYLLAPKGKEGLREAWRKGVEALVASIDGLVPYITSDVFSEGKSAVTFFLVMNPDLPISRRPASESHINATVCARFAGRHRRRRLGTSRGPRIYTLCDSPNTYCRAGRTRPGSSWSPRRAGCPSRRSQF